MSFESPKLRIAEADDWEALPGIPADRHFLFVSAPFGPFARELAGELEALGARCTRIILNGGDALDWGFSSALPYLGGLAGWAFWLRSQVLQRGVTDVVTYGDSNPYAHEALALARTLGLRRHVLEQGYFRPDWVTLQRNGVNGNSQLPRRPEWYLNHPLNAQPASEQRVGRTTPSAVFLIVRYHAAAYLGALAFPNYRSPYQHSAIRQAVCHARRFVGGRLRSRWSKRRHEKVMGAAGTVFLALLQRPGDSQLWRHSRYETTEAFVRRVVASFAAHAPAEAELVFRPHPLDPGIDDQDRLIRQIAGQEGVVRRVHYLDHGKLHEILPKVRGAVCVNSTAGLAAVEFSRPTITLGKAIYDMPGLTHQGELDDFWTSPQAPDMALFSAFRHVVMATTQVNGAYATRFGRKLAVPEVARRLMSPD